MDFGTLLHKAQRNEKDGKKEGVRYYSTKFEPPKKEQRNKQKLSANIKRFLAKKEAEEKEKRMEAHKKKEELFALRAKDKKATKRVNVMLKRTKSANQSVIQDAVDENNTSVTLAGPIQPDEDDYGYVSQEAAAFYTKMMEKYSKMPDEPKFNLNKKKKVSTDLNGTKERVKAALEREREEALMPHRRKRKAKEEPQAEKEEYREEAPPPKKPKVKAQAPPPMNFNDLLKLAEKKQFEPIVIEPKPKEEEKLLTKKQKKEMEREKEWRDRKEGKLPPLDKTAPSSSLGNILKSALEKRPKPEPKVAKVTEIKKIPNDKPIAAPVRIENTAPSKKPVETIKRNNININRDRMINREVPLQTTKPSFNTKSTTPNLKEMEKRRELPKPNLPERKKLPQGEVKPRQFPPKDLKPRPDFPPRDVKRKPMLVNKGRILDEDEDYDSEMDDFIDDGPEEGEDYSKYISEIFGYDKSRYRNVDDDVDNMESTFAQQMREEVISTKLGIMEDLEDMKLEEEQKRRKALMKKKNK